MRLEKENALEREAMVPVIVGVSTISSNLIAAVATPQPVARRWTWVENVGLWPSQLLGRVPSLVISAQRSALVQEVETVLSPLAAATMQVDVRPNGYNLTVA
jgi:hypothetical protein